METIKDIVSGVFVLLQGGIGRLSQNELDLYDVLEVGNDVMRGFMREAQMAQNELYTSVSIAQLVPDASGADYRVTVPSIPDFEPTRLEYGINGSQVSGWNPVNLVDLDAFAQFYCARPVYGSFYGSTYTPEGLKLRLNVLYADVAAHSWRLTYRLPMFTFLQLGQRPPLPFDFMRMVKLAWAIACVPIVKVPQGKMVQWERWKRDTLVQYQAEYLTWNNPNNPSNPGRWQDYLNGGVGSQTVALPRFDARRRHSGQMRGVIGVGGTWGVRE